MAAGSLSLTITLPYSLCNVKCKKMTLNHSLVSKKYVSQILKKTLPKQHNTTSICLTALLQSVLIFKFIHSCFLLYLPCYFYLLFFCVFFFIQSRRLSLNGHLCKKDTQSWCLPFFTPFTPFTANGHL